jgi:hypothetical protein
MNPIFAGNLCHCRERLQVSLFAVEQWLIQITCSAFTIPEDLQNPFHKRAAASFGRIVKN